MLNNIEELPIEINTPEINKAVRIMREMSMNELERETYNSQLDFLRMESSAFEVKLLEGIKIGEEKGRKEGKE